MVYFDNYGGEASLTVSDIAYLNFGPRHQKMKLVIAVAYGNYQPNFGDCDCIDRYRFTIVTEDLKCSAKNG